MRRLPEIVLCALLALWIHGNASGAAPKAPKPAKTLAETLSEEQDTIIRQCKPSEEQQKAIKEKFDLKRKALEAWDQANAAKLSAADAASKAARKSTDDAAKKKAGADLRALTQGRAQAATEADKAILAVLSAEQQAVWAGFQMAQSTLSRYKKANLTDDQTAKINACSLIAAQELATFTGDDRKDKQGRSTVQKCLKWAIDNVILTPEQRDSVAKKPASKK